MLEGGAGVKRGSGLTDIRQVLALPKARFGSTLRHMAADPVSGPLTLPP